MNQQEEENDLLVELIQLRGNAERQRREIRILKNDGGDVPEEMLYGLDHNAVRIQEVRTLLKQLPAKFPIDPSKIIGIIGPETLKQEPAERVRFARRAAMIRR